MTAPGSLTRTAPAKLNLNLHITGRRPDGYHELVSLIVFTEFGDTLTGHISGAGEGNIDLEIVGPMGGRLAPGNDNLVVRAAQILNPPGKTKPGIRFRLEKNIPVAAGLGGGSGDAAAAMGLLNELWHLGHDDQELTRLAEPLGADIPVCISSRAALVRGIGGQLDPAPRLPELHVLLVNPGVPVATADVFHRLAEISSRPAPEFPQGFADGTTLAGFLRTCRNDLEAPAIAIAPVIDEALKLVGDQPKCLLVRMSGSGGTIFGLFPDANMVAQAAAKIRTAKPEWWVMETGVPASV